MSGPVSVTRAQYLEAMAQLRASAAAMAEKFDVDQMTWQPGAGERWSISECLDHLAISTRIYLDAMQPAIDDARPGSGADVFQTAGFLSTKFVSDMEPPPRRKFPAPGKIRPRATLNPEAIPAEFLQAMDRVAALVASTENRNLNSLRFQNPFIPLVRFTVSTGFLIIAAHTRRHLWQAEEVTKESGFPAARRSGENTTPILPGRD